MYMHMHALYMYMYMYMYVYMYMYMYMYMYVYMYTRLHTAILLDVPKQYYEPSNIASSTYVHVCTCTCMSRVRVLPEASNVFSRKKLSSGIAVLHFLASVAEFTCNFISRVISRVLSESAVHKALKKN